MYIAMNRFRVIRGEEETFETLWKTRERHLNTVPGYLEFHLLRGPAHDDHTLYASHTVWESFEAFQAWTKSEQFRQAHARAGSTKPLYLGGPQFEGFQAVIMENRAGEPVDSAA